MTKKILENTNMEDLLLHRDGLILIINKPPHIPVHAGPKGGENLEQYFGQLQFGLPQPPALAHRLDRDTSGCLVLGRHRKALKKMGRLFRENRVDKTYWAVLEGSLAEDMGTIDLAMAKRSKDRRSWWMKVDPDGQEAITHFKVLGRDKNMTWVEFKPETGRTHQLRVHAEAIGHPIIGDSIYGNGPKNSPVPTLHLLAREITIPLQVTKDPITVTAPAPDHMVDKLKACDYSS
jgi:tRNA pseudouridine32 synthase/23S rRNA pseudouridine746 synthase